MADTSSSVKVMRAMVEAPHSCNSGSAVVLRGKRLQTSVSSYAAAGIVVEPAEEFDRAVPGVYFRGEAQVGEPPGQDLADLQGLVDVVFAGNLAAVPVAINRHLHGHPALLDAEIAPPGQVRGQVRRGNFTFPGGPLALPIDL